MALMDLSYGIISTPLDTLTSLGYPHLRFGWFLSVSLQLMIVNISIMALLATVIGQFVSIIKPFDYTTSWTPTISK